MEPTEKIVIIVTNGPNLPELATIPFVLAAGAIASDLEVAMAFQADGVDLIRKGGVDGVQARGFPPLIELLDSVAEMGGRLLACSPCLGPRAISSEDLIEAAEIIGAARLIAEVTSATTTLNY
jgi:predicted peroxiredoxin